MAPLLLAGRTCTEDFDLYNHAARICDDLPLGRCEAFVDEACDDPSSTLQSARPALISAKEQH
jgi:hypothetical protein